jgi:hypothetical protein
MQWAIVGQFRSRADADGHLRLLREHIPSGNFVVMFDAQLESAVIPAKEHST